MWDHYNKKFSQRWFNQYSGLSNFTHCLEVLILLFFPVIFFFVVQIVIFVLLFSSVFILIAVYFWSPFLNGHMSYGHKFVSVVVCKFFTFESSSLKRRGSMEPNFDGMFLGWYFTKFEFLVLIENSTWLPGPIMHSVWRKLKQNLHLTNHWADLIMMLLKCLLNCPFQVSAADQKTKMAVSTCFKLNEWKFFFLKTTNMIESKLYMNGTLRNWHFFCDQKSKMVTTTGNSFQQTNLLENGKKLIS